jgi:uncharacterized protein (TIGR00251 family)
MAYPILIGLSNRCPFKVEFAAEDLGLILCNSASYAASMSFKISVQVKTQARKENIVKISQQEYQVSVHAAAIAGKANQALIDLLARYFSVPKSSVKLLRGRSSRKKAFEIG